MLSLLLFLLSSRVHFKQVSSAEELVSEQRLRFYFKFKIRIATCLCKKKKIARKFLANRRVVCD